jgi:hypothetical protein
VIFGVAAVALIQQHQFDEHAMLRKPEIFHIAFVKKGTSIDGDLADILCPTSYTTHSARRKAYAVSTKPKRSIRGSPVFQRGQRGTDCTIGNMALPAGWFLIRNMPERNFGLKDIPHEDIYTQARLDLLICSRTKYV